MGNARFKSAEYAIYSDNNNFRSASREEIFRSSDINQLLDPAKIVLRESRDSESNPNSTPIIIGLDVTGSMGFTAEQIAKEGLPTLMKRIYEEQPVEDPHVMFMGIGDAYCDAAPLQVSQFEAGAIPLIEQLRLMWLEGGGGGNNSESYNLAWYFAANKTSIDSFEKRGKRGIIFTMGDEMTPTSLTSSQLTRIFGGGGFQSVDNESLLESVRERYQVFHIIVEEGNYAQHREDTVNKAWVSLLGPNVIRMKNHHDLPEIIVSVLKIINGENIESVIENSKIADNLRHAFSNASAE